MSKLSATGTLKMQLPAGQTRIVVNGFGYVADANFQVNVRTQDVAEAWSKGATFDGGEVTLAVSAGSGQFLEIDNRPQGVHGNIVAPGGTYNGNVVRYPSGTTLTLKFAPGYGDQAFATVTSVIMPTHTVSWTPGSVGNGATVSTTLTTNGARVGDLQAQCGAPGALGGLILWAEATAVNTTTLRLYNPTAAPITGPSGTYTVVQRR